MRWIIGVLILILLLLLLLSGIELGEDLHGPACCVMHIVGELGMVLVFDGLRGCYQFSVTDVNFQIVLWNGQLLLLMLLVHFTANSVEKIERFKLINLNFFFNFIIFMRIK